MKEEFEKKGYVVVRNALSSEQIDQLEKEAETFSEKEVEGADYYYEEVDGKKIIRRIERVSLVSPFLKALFHDGKVMEILTELFGEPAYLFKDKFNLKLSGGRGYPPHVDGHFQWQDEHGAKRKGWLEYSDTFINCVIPIDESTIENGCLEVADVAHYSKLGKDFDEVSSKLVEGTPNIPEALMKDIPMVPLETKKGDIIFFDWKCIHGSGVNSTPKSRRIMYSTYNAKSSGDQLDNYFNDKKNSQGSPKQKSLNT
ncbi:MAG: phytanoyl-CoA dioxygenase family protein [Nanoarchaeota archaeon]|nr:phytanoyl-CoA dioxygenase family protein [Nanoarchaeota archaeon]